MGIQVVIWESEWTQVIEKEYGTEMKSLILLFDCVLSCEKSMIHDSLIFLLKFDIDNICLVDMLRRAWVVKSKLPCQLLGTQHICYLEGQATRRANDGRKRGKKNAMLSWFPPKKWDNVVCGLSSMKHILDREIKYHMLLCFPPVIKYLSYWRLYT